MFDINRLKVLFAFSILRGTTSCHFFAQCLLYLSLRDLTQNFNLFSDIPQHTDHFLVAIHESKFVVAQALLLGKVFHKLTRTSEVMARQSREEMMCHLKMESSMDKFHRIRADHIRRSTQLSMGK